MNYKIGACVLIGISAVEAEKGSLATVREIAEYVGISASYVESAIPKLKKAGFVTGKRGPHGGYGMTAPLHLIPLGILRGLFSDQNRKNHLLAKVGTSIDATADHQSVLDLWRDVDRRG